MQSAMTAVGESMNAALLDSLSNMCIGECSSSEWTAEFPEQLADILDRYRQASQFLTSIREEKVWKTFKLCEAEFSLDQARGNYNACFQPMFDVIECEIHFLRWSMCQSDNYWQLAVESVEKCQHSAHSVLNSLKQIPRSICVNFAKELGIVRIECAVIVAETTMIEALIDFRRKNYMSAAHTMLKGYKLFKECLEHMSNQESLSDSKFHCEHIMSMCRKHRDSNSYIADQNLISSLQNLIAEKTKEIRGMSYDRTGDIPELVIEATRELLQMKELFRELTGKWKSSDGHLDAVIENIDGNTAYVPPSPAKNLTKASIADAGLYLESVNGEHNSEPGSESEHEHEHENVTPILSPVKSKRLVFDRKTVADLEYTYTHCLSRKRNDKQPTVNAGHGRENSGSNSLQSPKKMGLKVVNVVMPRFTDIARMLDLEAVDDNPQLRVRKTSQAKQMQKPNDANRVLGFGALKSPQKQGEASASVFSFISQPSDEQLLFSQSTELPSLIETHSENIAYKSLLLQRSRVLFGLSAFHLSLSLIPAQVSWMLTIIGLAAKPSMAMTALYTLHTCESCPWTHWATLLLANLPNQFIQDVFDADMDVNLLQQTCSIQRVEQFHPLIEAQSLLKIWTAKNPLWLVTSARKSVGGTGNCSSAGISQAAGLNLLTRVDFYRRALSSEKDAFSSLMTLSSSITKTETVTKGAIKNSLTSSTWNKYYDIHCSMAKHFLSLGHWTKALSASRQLPLPGFRTQLTLEAYALLRASSAALIVSEDFCHQNKYLQLKFADKIVCNANSSGAQLSSNSSSSNASTGTVRTKDNGHSTSAVDMSALVLSVNRQYALESLLSLASHQNISAFESSLYSRLLSYDHYWSALKRDSQYSSNSEAAVVHREYLASWCWLLPIEMTYLVCRAENRVLEAAHAQMLQLADKGMLLFSEKYLRNAKDAETAQHFLQLKSLINGIIIDDLTTKDSLVTKKSISPTCKLSLCFEQSLFARGASLRINADDPQGDHDSKIILNNLVNTSKQEISKGLQHVFKPNPLQGILPSARDILGLSFSSTSEAQLTKEGKAIKLLKKIVEKQEKISSAVVQSSFTMVSQQISDLYTVFNNQTTDRLVGDIVLLWLLARGTILMEMNRIWEAVMMFKLIECLKDIAPRSKFAVFIAYYKLATLVHTYDLCDSELVVVSEYLRRSAIYIQRAFEGNMLPYVAEYAELVVDMAKERQLGMKETTCI